MCPLVTIYENKGLIIGILIVIILSSFIPSSIDTSKYHKSFQISDTITKRNIEVTINEKTN